MNPDLSCTEAQTATAALISIDGSKGLDQTDYSEESNRGAKIGQNLETNHQNTVPKISVSQNENGCPVEVTEVKDSDNPEKSTQSSDWTVSENSTNKTEDEISKNLQEQNSAEEIKVLPKSNTDKYNTMGDHKEEENSPRSDLNSPLCQVSANKPGNQFDEKVLSDKSEELLHHKTPIPVIITSQTFASDHKEPDKKEEDEQVASQSQPVSTDYRPESCDAKVPGCLPSSGEISSIKPTANWKPDPPLSSSPENSNKDSLESNDIETPKDKTKILNSQTNVLPPSNLPLTDFERGESYSKENKVIDGMNDANLKVSEQCPQDSNTKALVTKPSVLLPTQLTTDCSTNSQQSHVGQRPVPGQTLPEPKRTLQPDILRKSNAPTPLPMVTAPYFENAAQPFSQNKFGNEIKPKNPVNLHDKNQTKRTNQNKMITNQGRLNAIDACSKLIPNNLKALNPIRPRIKKAPKQPNQTTTQPIRLSTLPNNGKGAWESERFSFPVTTGMNTGFAYNQRPSNTGYDIPSVPYIVYSDNSNISNRPSPTGSIANNNPSIQRSGIYSVQPLNQNMTRLGSPYFLMWPSPGEQTGPNKLTMTQTSNTPGIIPSYQNSSRNPLSNPDRESGGYPTPTSTNDTKRCKNQFSEGGLNLMARQPNPGERSNPTTGHDGINRQQGTHQAISGTYTNGQPIPPQQSEMFMNRGNDNIFSVSQNSMQRGQSAVYMQYQSPAGHNGNGVKIRPSNPSQSDQQFYAQNQGFGSYYQRSSYDQYQELPYYYSGPPVPNANNYSLPGALPRPKTQTMTGSNLHTGYAQHPASSINSNQNSDIPTLQGQAVTNTTTTSATLTTPLSSTKEVPKKKDFSTREGPSPVTGQHPEPQGFQKKNPELDVAHQDNVFTKYPTQANMTNISQQGSRFLPPDTNTSPPIYNKDAYTNKGHMFYNQNNSDNNLVWSQYHQPNFDPTKLLHPSQRGYMSSDPPHGERNLTQYNFQLQNNIHSHFYASPSYNNYAQQVHPSFDPLQGIPRPQNPSSAGGNVAATYNSTATGQNFENFRMENQANATGEKFPVGQEISINMAADQATWKAEDQDNNNNKEGFPAQSETSDQKPPSGEQFQNYNFANNLYPKVPEKGTDTGNFTQISTPTATTSTKTTDLLTRVLSNPNFDMTTEESFLFSDFDPLFTSSLLTNDLEYFPENNAAFDQCFEDAASIALSTVIPGEARNHQSLDPVEPSQESVQQQQQQQLTSLVNIPSNTSAASSVPNIPSSQIYYNQVPPLQTALGSDQIKGQYNSSDGDFKNLVPLTNKPNESILGYSPGVNIPKMGPGDFTRPIDLYPDDSIVKRFSDLCTSKTASQLAKTINDYKYGKKWANKNLESDQTGTVMRKQNRQKNALLPGEEGVKKLKKKTAVPKGPPRPRGRPPKNRSLMGTGPALIQPAVPRIGEILPKPISDLPKKVPVNDHTLETEQNLKNSSPLLPACENTSTGPESKEDPASKNSLESDKSDGKIFPKESSLVSEEPERNACSTNETPRELSDQDVLAAVTKCLESITRNEETDNSDQKESQLDASSENADLPLDGPVQAGKDLQSVEEDISKEDQALSKEEKLMKAYVELKKKLEERMSRSLWRQSILKRNEQKSNKAFRKLSKKECMTAYSGTSSWGPDDDLFSRYPNRSSTSNSKLVATADSTSTNIDSKSDKETDCPNPEVIDIEIDKRVENQISDTNDQLISSTELSEPKDENLITGTTLRLPSMMEVVRTRLADDLSSPDNTNPEEIASETSKEQPESPVKHESVKPDRVPSEDSKPTGEDQNLEEEINSNEAEQIEDPKGGDATNQEPKQPPAPAPRHSILQPYSPTPLLPPVHPPPQPTQVVHFLPNRHKVTPRKVGPTIVENAKICYEVICKYLTRANSDFDSFLISYANIVQGLLNCGAERYGRIRAILLNKSKQESSKLVTQEDKETAEHMAVNTEEPGAKDSSEFPRDIDASDIQGVSCGGENTIDVEEFGSSYADIVRVILSSRADEYRNIKQVLSKNICGGTDTCQGSTTKSVGQGKISHDVGSISAPTVCVEANDPPLTKVKRKRRKKALDGVSTNPSKVIKKRRKRKTQEEGGRPRVENNVLSEEKTYSTETSRKKTPKRNPPKIQYSLSTPKDRKRGSSGSREKSPSFRIILSSNYFADQNVKDSNLSVKSKTKKHNTNYVEEDHEDAESRRSQSSDDGFVEESTGDYVIGLGCDSGEEEKYSTIFKTEPLSMFEQTFGNMDTAQITNTSQNVQSKTPDVKPVSWYEDVLKTEKHTLSANELNFDKEADGKDGFPGGESKTTAEGLKVKVEASTVNIMKQEEKKKQRPSRKAASAGVGAIRCPCGCSNDGSSLMDDSVETQLRDLTMSFKNRNRSKIIKPKSASIPKKRGRPRKIDKCPQKIISKLWTDISATGEEDEGSPNQAKVLSDCEEPVNPEIYGTLVDTFSITNAPLQIPASNDDTIGHLSDRREISKLDSDSDSEDLRNLDIFMRGSSDSNDSWKPKKSQKRRKLETLKRKKRNFLKYNLFPSNIKAPFIDDHDLQQGGTDQKLTEESQTKMDRTASEEDKSFAKKNNSDRKKVSKSLSDIVSTKKSSLKKFSQNRDNSKTRFSFKDFIPNLKLPSVSKTPSHNLETPKETGPEDEHSNPSHPIKTNEDTSETITQNDSNVKKEYLQSFNPADGAQNLIVSNAEDGDSSKDDIKYNINKEIKVYNERSQNDTNLQPKVEDCRNLTDVSKGHSGNIEIKSECEYSERPKESSEERLRSLIEKITEINAATKGLDINSSVSVESELGNIEKVAVGKDLPPVDAVRNDLPPVDAVGKDLPLEDVDGTNLQSIDAVRKDLQSVDIDGTNLQSVNAVGKDLQSVDAVGKDLQSVDAVGKDLQSVDAVGKDLQSVDAVGKNLQSVDIDRTNLHPVDTVGTNLSPVDTDGTNLQSVDVVDTNLQSSDAVETNLHPVDAVETNLQSVDAVETNLKSVDAVETNLQSVDAVETNLQSVDAVETNLHPVDVVDTNLHTVDADCRPKDGEGMRVKIELVERIDENIHCPIGLSDTDDSSSSSSSDSSSSYERREKKKRKRGLVSKTLGGILEVKMPSPLNSKKKKANQTLKVQSIGFENKIIIRKTGLKKEKTRIRNRQKREDKNIFDILSQNESEDEESCSVRQKVDSKNEESSNCLPYSLKGKKEVSSKIPPDINTSDRTQRLNTTGKPTISRRTKKVEKKNIEKILYSHSDKPSILLQTEAQKSPVFSENANSSPEKSLETLKKKKRKLVKLDTRLLTGAQIPIESNWSSNNSDSYPMEHHKNLISNVQSIIDDSVGSKVGLDKEPKAKKKKTSNKSKRDEESSISKDNEVCFSLDVQKGKKRKKSFGSENNLTPTADLERGRKEKLIVSGAMRRNKKTKIDDSFSNQGCDTPLKPECPPGAVDGNITRRRRANGPAEDRPPLQCTYCPKTFKKPSELLYHTRNHTGERPFTCNQCDKSFVSNAHLLRHHRTHSAERKHVCPTCGRAFTQHYGMLVHQLIHSGLKPHKCPDCSRAFRTKGCVGTHRRKHHPEQIAKEKEAEIQKDSQDSK